MKLKTSYLGLELKSPIIVSSSTLTGNVESIKHCAEAGAGAVVLKSIFEEQILSDIKKEEGYTDIYNSCSKALIKRCKNIFYELIRSLYDISFFV